MVAQANIFYEAISLYSQLTHEFPRVLAKTKTAL